MGLLEYQIEYPSLRDVAHDCVLCTVRKMDLILRSIERRPQMQFSMGCRFNLQLFRRYGVKFSKMHNFMLGTS